MAVYSFSGTQYAETKPISGMKMMKVVLSQLTCWYQLPQVMGLSEMCPLAVSYLEYPRRGL